jgi:hypothetical protein
MKKILFSLLLTLHASLLTFSQLQSPKDYFGFEPGTDKMLFTYEQMISYLQKLDEASPMLQLTEIGQSAEGKPMYVCFISSEENIRNLDRLKEINRKLALDPYLTDEEQASLVKEGKVFFIATLSMHANEVGPSQSAPLIAYELLSSMQNETQNSKLKIQNSFDPVESLKDVVYMMVPSQNPDGMDQVVEYYLKTRDTKLEGANVPGVYQKYTGHDNNRDFVILSQPETKAISALFDQDWFPQVMVEKHQMGGDGVRYYVPPPHDPIAENVDAEIWNWVGLFGSNMIKDMTAQGQKGIAHNYLFDDYWPGCTETCIWKNMIGMLTEGASVKVATPVYIEPNEIEVDGKGLSEYKKSINMPDPWPGGWWHLSDLIAYERSSTYSIIKTASANKQEILKFRNDLCRKEVNKGMTEAPYSWVIPVDQPDKGELVRLVNLLKEHGAEVYTLNQDIQIGQARYAKGDVVVPLDQPFRAFIKEVMEKQVFPLRHYTPGGEPIRPYDITTWSLPLHNGVRADEIREFVPDIRGKAQLIEGEYSLKEGMGSDFWGMGFPVERNESFKAAFLAKQLGFMVDRITEPIESNGKKLARGSFLVYGNAKPDKLKELYEELSVDPIFLNSRPEYEAVTFELPRIALVETWLHDMDAGWTRYVFDSYHIPYKTIRPDEFEKADLVKDYDVIIFPSVSKDILMEGKNKAGEDEYYISNYSPEYTKGMGEKGMDNLMKFLDNGGLIISWGSSTGLFDATLSIKRSEKDIEAFQLPFNDISKDLKDLYCPGSLVSVRLAKDSPITMGMPATTAVFYRGRPVFSTSIPRFDMDRRVVGTFPEKDILLSGYIEKEELLSDKSNLIWLKKGKGQLVLFAFNPQFRASTAGNYKLLFNSVMLDKIK